MKLLVFFGLPGVGKTYIGKIAQKYFGYYLYDGDQDMSDAYKKAVEDETMTDTIRQAFFDRLITNIGKVEKEKVIVTQTFIREKFREQFLDAYPQAKFILIEATTDIREKRLMGLGRFELPLEKWRRMNLLFEKPHIVYETITNNEEGEEALKEQLQKILI